VQITQAPVTSVNSVDGMLGQIEDLLDESRKSRSIISSIVTGKELNLN
jgi:hypothetical protein